MFRFLLLVVLLREASTACWKQLSCQRCVAQTTEQATCLWHSPSRLPGTGICVAGELGYKPPKPSSAEIAEDAYGLWSMKLPDGRSASFTVSDVDQVSEGSCYDMPCSYQGKCNVGYYATSNKPCYGDNTFPEWRLVTCCRQQRNANGYLRGFEAVDGIIQGKLFYAACCVECYPGEVNSGCHAYHPGECVTCPKGRFNPVSRWDATCLECEPCGPGMARYGCGPSTGGLCRECKEGTFKLLGLEGSFHDECTECEKCPKGYIRAGCGGDNAGWCEPCKGGSFFASPICRNCAFCELGRQRRGCSGKQPGVCTRCDSGKYEAPNGNCIACAPCDESELPQTVDGLNLTGAWVRVGCGGFSPGKCIRFAAALDTKDSELCPSAKYSNALCEDTELSLRWTVAGLPTAGIEADFGNCTEAAGLCLSAFWRVLVFRRRLDTFGGSEIEKLGEWFSEDVASLQQSGIEHASLLARGLKIAKGLPEGPGYFLRVSLHDRGGSCCLEEAVPTSAESEDFVLASRSKAEENLWRSLDDVSEGRWEEAIAVSDAACRDSDSSRAWEGCERAKALQLGLPAGQRALVPLPFLLNVETPELAARTASHAVTQVGELLQQWEKVYEGVGARLPSNTTAWASLVEPLVTLLSEHGRRLQSEEENASSNTTAEGNSSQTGATSTVAPASSTAAPTTTQAVTAESLPAIIDASPLAALRSGALEAAFAADALGEQWASEVASSAQLLPQRLKDLREVDRLVAESAIAAGFDIVRMAQASIWSLQEDLSSFNDSLSVAEQEQMLSTALQRAGNLALMLVGTWKNSWYPGLEWRLLAEVGDASMWPPAGVTWQDFGGVHASLGAVETNRTRRRVWEPFVEVTQAWLALAEQGPLMPPLPTTTTELQSTSEVEASTTSVTSTPAETSTAAASSTPAQSSTAAQTVTNLSSGNVSNGSNATRRLDSGQQPGWAPSGLPVLAPLVRQVMLLVDQMTEEVLEPLTRPQSKLLAGPLPNISQSSLGICGSKARGWCLSFASNYFDEDLALGDAWHGFGAAEMRPWVDPRIEDLRLKRAASEMVSLMWGRLRLLEELLMQLADVREIQREPHDAAESAAAARAAADHMASLVTWAHVPGNFSVEGDRLDSAWHFQEVSVAIRGTLDEGRSSAARLARRRLGRLERLAAWAAKWKDDGKPEGPDWSWRQPWAPWSARKASGDSSTSLLEASEAASAAFLQGISDAEAHASVRSQAYLRIEAGLDDRPVAYGGLLRTGKALIRLRAPKGMERLMMHSQADAFLISPSMAPGVSPLQPAEDSGDAPSASYNTPHIEVRLTRVGGGFDTGMMEPPEPSGAQPFLTRHERLSCSPMSKLLLEEHPELVPGALLPLDGLWTLTVRDGTTAKFVTVDEGTVLRLLFKVDVPDGVPPWKLLTDSTDVLYRMPEDGKCDALRPIFGSAPITSTFPPTTRTTLFTETSTVPNPPRWQTTKKRFILVEGEDVVFESVDEMKTFVQQHEMKIEAKKVEISNEADSSEKKALQNQLQALQQDPNYLKAQEGIKEAEAQAASEGFLAPAAPAPPAEPQEPWRPPMWVIATIFLGGLASCSAVVLLGSWCRKRRRRILHGKIAPDEVDEEGELGTKEPSEKTEAAHGLRQRLPSPKQSVERYSGDAGQKLRELANAPDPLASKTAEVKPAPLAPPSARNWDITDTPRGDDADDTPAASEKSWSEAQTPSQSPRSAASCSSLGSDSGSGGSVSSSSSGSVERPRAALAARAAAIGATAGGGGATASPAFPPRSAAPAPPAPGVQLPMLGPAQQSEGPGRPTPGVQLPMLGPAQQADTSSSRPASASCAAAPRPAAELASTHVSSSDSSGSRSEREDPSVQGPPAPKPHGVVGGDSPPASSHSGSPPRLQPGSRPAPAPALALSQLSPQAERSGDAPLPPPPSASPPPLPPEESAPAPLPPDLAKAAPLPPEPESRSEETTSAVELS
eukprot:TRINITY_DN8107_c0_g1_i2.p1 TRINITY_DN8107_c0_g1~~TRINITY_DN8107_c0_g1_i2.p1  ORF type:complete len:1998 (+),score=392.70 TRINITY_DN8107_c0_g1_i2:92-5995(+)